VKAFNSHSNRLDALEKAMQPKGVKLKLDRGVPADAPTPVLVKTLMGNGVPVYSSSDVAAPETKSSRFRILSRFRERHGEICRSARMQGSASGSLELLLLPATSPNAVK
jgi:hypothetical protein